MTRGGVGLSGGWLVKLLLMLVVVIFALGILGLFNESVANVFSGMGFDFVTVKERNYSVSYLGDAYEECYDQISEEGKQNCLCDSGVNLKFDSSEDWVEIQPRGTLGGVKFKSNKKSVEIKDHPRKFCFLTNPNWKEALCEGYILDFKDEYHSSLTHLEGTYRFFYDGVWKVDVERSVQDLRGLRTQFRRSGVRSMGECYDELHWYFKNVCNDLTFTDYDEGLSILVSYFNDFNGFGEQGFDKLDFILRTTDGDEIGFGGSDSLGIEVINGVCSGFYSGGEYRIIPKDNSYSRGEYSYNYFSLDVDVPEKRFETFHDPIMLFVMRENVDSYACLIPQSKVVPGMRFCNGDVYTGCRVGSLNGCTVPDEEGVCAIGEQTCIEGVGWENCRKVNFGSKEFCSGGVDEDCDGKIDCGDTTDCRDQPCIAPGGGEGICKGIQCMAV